MISIFFAQAHDSENFSLNWRGQDKMNLPIIWSKQNRCSELLLCPSSRPTGGSSKTSIGINQFINQFVWSLIQYPTLLDFIFLFFIFENPEILGLIVVPDLYSKIEGGGGGGGCVYGNGNMCGKQVFFFFQHDLLHTFPSVFCN